MFKNVSRDVPNYQEIEAQLLNIAEMLEHEKQNTFDRLLDSLGLKLINGVVVQKEANK